MRVRPTFVWSIIFNVILVGLRCVFIWRYLPKSQYSRFVCCRNVKTLQVCVSIAQSSVRIKSRKIPSLAAWAVLLTKLVPAANTGCEDPMPTSRERIYVVTSCVQILWNTTFLYQVYIVYCIFHHNMFSFTSFYELFILKRSLSRKNISSPSC